jgi:hypothetical protein
MQVWNFLQQCCAICHSNPSQNTAVLSTTNSANVLAKYSSYKSEQIWFGITLLLSATFTLAVIQMADVCNTRQK